MNVMSESEGVAWVIYNGQVLERKLRDKWLESKRCGASSKRFEGLVGIQIPNHKSSGARFVLGKAKEPSSWWPNLSLLVAKTGLMTCPDSVKVRTVQGHVRSELK